MREDEGRTEDNKEERWSQKKNEEGKKIIINVLSNVGCAMFSIYQNI